jgi:Ca2+-binding EF-hand superfamily protein
MADVTGEHSMNYRRTWRTGIWTTLMSSQSLAEQAELHMVSHIQGDVDETFKRVDVDGSGSLDREELKKVLIELRVKAGGNAVSVTDDDVSKLFEEISHKVPIWDKAKPAEVTLKEFHEWYRISAGRITDQVTSPGCNIAVSDHIAINIST